MAEKQVDYGSGRSVLVDVPPEMETGSREIAQQMGVQVDQQGRIRSADPGHAPGRSRDPQYESRMLSLKTRLKATGVVPATVFNFLPFILKVNSPVSSVQGGVPAVKGNKEFATRTWDTCDIQIVELGEQGRSPQEFHPIQIAQVFEYEYPAGGVVAIQCRPKDAGRADVAKLLKEHAAQAVIYMRGQMEMGEKLWNAPDRIQRQNVRSVHRACAQRLYDLHIIKALPDFCSAKVDLEDAPHPCINCGKVPDSKLIAQCQCGWVINPGTAFQNNIIQEDDPALERLTRAEVKLLGISDYVAETSDEKPKRLKSGAPKPFSAAATRALDAVTRADKANAAPAK
ncbi:MAG TPA: hypothetical protein VGG42_09825 [Acidobacteriaceae bacterium]|jgi:hypothetical protein